MDNSIIVVDDEQAILQSVRRGLITSGFKNLTLLSDPVKAAKLFEQGDFFDVALIDMMMPEMDGLELLGQIKRYNPETECIIITATDDVKTAVKAMRNGAYDYLVKPVEKEDLILAIKRALERARLHHILDIGKGNKLPELLHEDAFMDIKTGSKSMLKILKEAELHALSDVPILITGESGTGKELLAKAIHRVSPRSTHTFTPVNMAALTTTLFDSEFFGHTKGAFTGAEKDRPGYLEHTHKGTLFLDEIGTLPMELQGKLLRVLQDGEFIKIGTDQRRKIDVRFVAATNENLEQLLAKKRFRNDLYYRLKGGWLHLPPLRMRRNDIPLLAHNFLIEFYGSEENPGIEERALFHLLQYDYPGNIRELKGIIQTAVNLSQGRTISENHLPAHLKAAKPKSKNKTFSENEPVTPLLQMEKKYILKVYDQTGKNKSQTARLLGIGLNTLRRKLESYG